MSGANERSPRSEVADSTFFVDRNFPTNDEVDLPKIEAAVRNILAAVGRILIGRGYWRPRQGWPACTQRCLRG